MDKVNLEREKEVIRRRNPMLTFILSILAVGIIACGCAINQNKQEEPAPAPEAEQTQEEDLTSADVNVPADVEDIEIDIDAKKAGEMISYDVTSIGRADPFMPYGELLIYNEARNSALAEANEYNARIAKIKAMQGKAIREADDISPYSFNLPVPPTLLGPSDTAAAKITRTKVVGIMYNEASPTAIINVDNKDYLVRPGDKIIGQEYKVMKINPNWITVSLGSNVYSAAIGELFSKEDLSGSQNDLYNLKNRFGGRKG